MGRSYRKKTAFGINCGLLCLLLISGLSALLSGCAYRLGSPDRSLPGGYRQISIPIFKNLSQEPGIEVSYTNSLIQEFERSRIAKVTPPEEAGATIEGVITSVDYYGQTPQEGGSLPRGTVLWTSYRIVINVHVTLKKQADKSVLWQGDFNSERTYQAPQVTQAGLNSADPLYNLSARRQNIDVLASEMMSEAHDRLTENF